MHYIIHYNIHATKGSEITRVLDFLDNVVRIKYFYDDGFPVSDKLCSLSFEISEKDPHFDEIGAYLNEIKSADPSTSSFVINGYKFENRVNYLCFPVYSKSEYDSADWFSVRSTNLGIMDLNVDRFVYSCEAVDSNSVRKKYTHRYISNHIVVNRNYKWRNKFFGSGVLESDLLCSASARQILEANDIKGIEYNPVYTEKSDTPSSDIFRITPINKLSDSTIVSIADYDEYICPTCHMKMLCCRNTRGTYGLAYDELDNGIDIYETPPMFLSDIDNPFYGSSETIISKRFYNLLKKDKIDRTLVYEPIPNVSK